ncbi:MAG: hypothetical protein GEV11_03705 [Streptosporangiales bacterium]|nr:hypothetical protein [Streptosporangiales bacterium]
MHRRSLAACLTAAFVLTATCVFTVVTATPAHAAPARGNGDREPVYLVYGHSGSGVRHCTPAWRDAKAAFRRWGWDGPLITWGYYRGGTDCTRYYRGTTNTRLITLGKALARDIYRYHTSRGRSVDVLAHSMGGLVVRAALTGVRKYHGRDGWPPYLYIEDVATLGTPHNGTPWALNCRDTSRQCTDMLPGSAFLRWLTDEPQSAQRTDWTLIGSGDDRVVPPVSALGMTSRHKILFTPGQDMGHSTLRTEDSGRYRCLYKHGGVRWKSTTACRPPLLLGRHALYHASAW